MALWVCSGCSTRYAPGLERCPHCSSPERTEEGGGRSRLPWIEVACPTAACPAAGVARRVYLRQVLPGIVELPSLGCLRCGGAMPAVAWRPPPKEETDMPKITAHGGPTNAAEAAVASDAVGSDATVTVDTGGEQPSAGNSSSTSAEKPPSSDDTNEPAPQKPARTTASRSKRARTASSTASSTDTSGADDDVTGGEDD